LTGYGLDGRRLIPVWGKIFLFSTASRPALGPNQPPTQWIPVDLSSGVKQPGREADRSPVSSSSSSINLSRDRSIVSSKLSFSVFGERLSRKNINNVVVFPFAFHIALQQPLRPLWSRLLLCDHEPSQPSTVLCFMSLLMSSTEVKNGGVIPPFPHISSWHSAQLINHRNNFAYNSLTHTGYYTYEKLFTLPTQCRTILSTPAVRPVTPGGTDS
jgi:hypothetical protein